eukprot:3561325-Rhodomonas_salina.2
MPAPGQSCPRMDEMLHVPHFISHLSTVNDVSACPHERTRWKHSLSCVLLSRNECSNRWISSATGILRSPVPPSDAHAQPRLIL